MTIRDGDGIYGASTSQPAPMPKGLVGRTDNAASPTEIGERIAATATSFSSFSDAAKSAANIVFSTTGVYDLIATGVFSRAAGAVNTQEISIGISTVADEIPDNLTSVQLNKSTSLNATGNVLSLSATKFQVLQHMLHDVYIVAGTTYHANLQSNGGGSFDGDATFYAVRRA